MQLFIVLGMFFLTGAASLILEVTWSRQVGLLFGHTVQGAAIVLASYFSGMTAGYLLGRKLVVQLTNPLRLYGRCEIIAGIWALTIPWILDLAGEHLPFIFAQYEPVLLQTAIRALFAFLLLLPATIAMGVTLPAIAAYSATPKAENTASVWSLPTA